MCVSEIRFSVVILLALLATMTGGCTQSRVRAVDIFDEVWTIVSEEFHDPNYGGVDWNSLRNRYRPEMESARGVEDCARIINTMLGELKTSHTGYYTPEETAYYGLLDIFNQGQFGEKIRKIFPGGVVRYSGIGIQTQLINGKRFVIDVPESSPAAEAGLKVGDEILGVRGASGRRSGGTSGGGRKLFHPVDSFRGR
ncbi:MAG: PDZ domain-containing protein, partial [Planctomycetes bacterium]|nr:PDZ domain-containing protein [Planctomycetota bacterium]